MNNLFSQQARQGRLSSILGTDVLVLLRMDGSEELSGDFEWRVEALSDQSGLDLHGLLGTHATVEIDHADGTRPFDGIVCEARVLGAFENGFRYDLVLRPWLHAASLRRNMRIFHNRTVIDIVEEVLSAYAGFGRPHLENRVTGDYPILEYTVQYGESDADFVRRQLERHGISWSWRHEAGNHTLLLTDATFSLPEISGVSRPYYGVGGFHQHEEEHFSLWSSAERITTGAVRLTEYNFKIPMAAQEVDHMGDATHPGGDIESYDWPGDYLKQGEGKGVVNSRVDAERGQAPRHEAEGDVISLGAGYRVSLRGEEVPNATGRTFVCLKAQHRFRAQAYGTGNSGNDETPYQGSYVLMPDDTPYRPERRAIGPRVQGPETAVVVGDGEIDCDEYGRILCRFHWDQEGAHTMRVRVSQSWASKGWGGMVIPRIGMEVIVEHLRGDPDKPIVTGCVFNGKNDAPYPLPEHKTKSVFRSDSHQSEGFNELTMEDDTGNELMFIHAQKDQTTRILNDRTRRVDRHEVSAIGANRVVEVGNNQKYEVGGSLNRVVGGTGVSALALMASVAGLAGHTAGLLKQAGDAAGGGGPGLSAFASTLASSTLGFLAGGGTLNRNRVVSSSSNRPDAGRALNSAGTGVGDAAAGLFPMPGVFNSVVGSFRSDTVGVAHAEQIGLSKVTNVGATSIESVGKYKKVAVGEELVLECGDSKIVMKSNGEILILGKEFNFIATDHFQLRGKPIDMN